MSVCQMVAAMANAPITSADDYQTGNTAVKDQAVVPTYRQRQGRQHRSFLRRGAQEGHDFVRSTYRIYERLR